MNLVKSHAKKSVLVGLLFFLFHISVDAQNGEQLYKQNCASCHGASPTKGVSAPALAGVLSRGPWAEDKKNIYEWIHNPAGFMADDPYTQGLKAQYGVMMPAFAALKENEIDAIVDYVMAPPATGGGDQTGGGTGAVAEDNSGRNALIFGIISLVLALIALILMQVNSNLKKLSDDQEGIIRPEAVPFYRNKIYIALVALVLFVVGGFFVAKGAINLGRQKGYQPTQPIYFSHKVHAGINQINCLYCHNGAWESKHAGIPTLNVCMNCHNVVSEYAGKYEMKDKDGKTIDGTAEIQKLYQYAGFTPGPAATWDASRAKSPEWIKIHNLPDHVYFNHAQHTRIGNVQCQTCHGSIQEMDKVSQQAELSMGWCINCHRDSKVSFNYNDSTGNRFYSLYEKFHNDIKKGKMDSVTVQDIGGLECQKCHY